MFSKLKRRLVLLYGITSSIILSVIIIGVYIINNRQSQEQNMVLFQKNVEQIVEKFRLEDVINNTWLVRVQEDNRLFVYVEDNGIKLTKYNQMSNLPGSQELIEKIKKLSIEDGINLDRKPLYSTLRKTPVYNVSLSNGKAYYSMAALIPKNAGWLNIMVISCDNQGPGILFKQMFLYVFIDFIGVAALFLISSLYIGKVIKPLEEGQKRQVAFVAAASHELRTPLTVIKAGISSIREDISKSDNFLPHIEEECNRMTRLISDMLLLASSDAKTWSLLKEPVEIDTLLIETYDMFCTCYNNKNYQLTLDLPEEELHVIHGDKERIKQIFTILIDNAMSHTTPGENIALHAYNQKNYVVVEVEDHGHGICDEDKKQVFERFYRGDGARNDKKHFGLGLSIAKELIELHEGSIFIKDTPGGGATFVLRLPW
ncbi:sensor histidine kinase [Anaerocolumna aminovalerica]|uniref:sensor histidine kinase n=1 Tax=Anaerocolumna aminovalerica TaxID=1527 RepID=UPI00248BEF26|nr:HAMP domain-containing sensor histidine kinase [Anaerocolumna aminovalerica]